jgi:hypothetical protein
MAGKKPVNIEREHTDSRKISHFTIQLLGIKYFADEVSNHTTKLPENLMVSFNFFDFPLFKTKTLTYLNRSAVNKETAGDD